MIRQNDFNEFYELLTQTYNRIKDIEHTIYKIDNSISLFPVEIHILVEINNMNDIGVIELAEKLNVTKGAVSQKIALLCKKGCLVKKNSTGRRKQLILTEIGRHICHIHNERGMEMLHNFKSKLDQFSDEEMQTLNKMMNQILNFYDAFTKFN